MKNSNNNSKSLFREESDWRKRTSAGVPTKDSNPHAVYFVAVIASLALLVSLVIPFLPFRETISGTGLVVLLNGTGETVNSDSTDTSYQVQIEAVNSIHSSQPNTKMNNPDSEYRVEAQVNFRYQDKLAVGRDVIVSYFDTTHQIQVKQQAIIVSQSVGVSETNTALNKLDKTISVIMQLGNIESPHSLDYKQTLTSGMKVNFVVKTEETKVWKWILGIS